MKNLHTCSTQVNILPPPPLLKLIITVHTTTTTHTHTHIFLHWGEHWFQNFIVGNLPGSNLNSPNLSCTEYTNGTGRIHSLINFNPNKRSPTDFSTLYHTKLAMC